MTTAPIRVRLVPSMRPTRRYLFRASWRGTAKLFWIEANNEEDAWKKAARSKESEGCLDLELKGESNE